MIIVSNRQDEIIARTTKRLVTAMIYTMAPPQPDKPTNNPRIMGLFIDNKKSVVPLTAQDVLQNAEVWQWEDECITPLQKGSDVLSNAVEAMRARTARANGDFLDMDTRKAVFNSEDIISRATGLAPQMHFDFLDAVKPKNELIETVPFVRLKKYLRSLDSKLGTIGGQVTAADVAHSDSMSAFDYYEISFGHHIGHRFSYGDVMLAKGRKLLDAADENRRKRNLTLN